jgi:sensor histidine kinase YesM
MIAQHSFTLAISIMLLIIGISLATISLMAARATSAAIAMAWLGTSCLAFGIWDFSSNQLALYMLPMHSLLYTLSYVGMLSVVSPLTAFYRKVTDQPDSIALRSISAVAALLALSAILMHLLGIIPFATSGVVIRPFVPLALIALGLVILVEYLQLRESTVKSLVAPALLLALFAIADLVNLLLIRHPGGDRILQVGFLIFTGWMVVFGGNFVRQRFEMARQSRQLSIEVDTMASNLEKQRELYQQLSESSEQVRAMRHDFRHQLSALHGFLEEGNLKGAVDYIEQLEEYTPSFARMTLTDNFAINAVVSHYLLLAQSNNIDTDLQLVVPTDLGQVSDSDLSIIFGNLFENAIEASLYLPEEQRVIRMRCQVVKSNLTLIVDNAFDGNYESRGGVFYSRKRTGRGIGLSSVRTIVERYQGSMKVEVANGQFMVSLMIKL